MGFCYVIAHCEYENYDTYEKLLNNAYQAFYGNKTQCYGYTLLVKAFLDGLGIENIVMGGKYAKEGTYDYYFEANKEFAYQMHAWNLVKVDNHWYHLDTTFADNPALEVPEQFFLSGNDIAKKLDSGRPLIQK